MKHTRASRTLSSWQSSSQSSLDPLEVARPLIGNTISLISKDGVRYDGTLLQIDSEKGDLILGNGTSSFTSELFCFALLCVLSRFLIIELMSLESSLLRN